MVDLGLQGESNMKKPIVLASQSPRRKELLAKIVPDFIVEAADVDETIPSTVSIQDAARFLSEKKAQAIGLRYPEQVIIGCDTIVLSKDEILGKPIDLKDAKRMLHLLSGVTHQVITGCTVIFPGGEKASFSAKTEVTFFPLTDKEIEEYLQMDEAFDKAGAYGIQGDAAKFVQKISGDYYSVMGLPVSALYQILKEKTD